MTRIDNTTEDDAEYFRRTRETIEYRFGNLDGEPTPDDAPKVFVVRACACHDGHGYSLDKDGTMTETYTVARCVKHREVPSLYEKLK